jgi:outer membrane protein
MKKILLIASMALISLAATAQVKIGHVNISEIVQLMPEADEARAQMSATAKEADETYQSMAEEFNTKYQEYQQKAGTWTAAIRESKEKALTDMQQRIQEFQQQIQQELQQQQQNLMAPIYKKAQDAVNSIAKSKGVTVVFDSSSLLYHDDVNTVDLTVDVRKAVNIPEGRTLEQLQKELAASQEAQ